MPLMGFLPAAAGLVSLQQHCQGDQRSCSTTFNLCLVSSIWGLTTGLTYGQACRQVYFFSLEIGVLEGGTR